MVSEVPRCQTVKTAVHHDAQLISDSLWHVQDDSICQLRTSINSYSGRHDNIQYSLTLPTES